MTPAIVTLVSDTTLITIASSVFGVIVSAVVGWLIARQNRAAALDVARQETSAAVASTKEQAEQEAYTRARSTLESTIAAQDRIIIGLRADAERCVETVHTQAEQIEGLEKRVRHLTNQDAAKQRIIDRMRVELTDATTALALKFPDE